MDNFASNELIMMSRQKDALDASVSYLASHLRQFVKKRDKVIICFPEHAPDNISGLMEQAVLKCEAVPLLWGNDHRWKSLMQLAFFSRASVIIGPPLIILGLSKLQKHNGLPLYIRHVVTSGYSCKDWVVEGIKQGLDCQVWGCLGVGISSAVAGFSCGKSLGVHIRQEEYDVEIQDAQAGVGRILLRQKSNPECTLLYGERGKLEYAPCACGCDAPRLMDIHPGVTVDKDLLDLGQYLNSWTSVLDCNLKRGDFGLELELVVFPGEKLPQLPSVAKQIIRPWDPKHDAPFAHSPLWNWNFSAERD